MKEIVKISDTVCYMSRIAFLVASEPVHPCGYNVSRLICVAELTKCLFVFEIYSFCCCLLSNMVRSSCRCLVSGKGDTQKTVRDWMLQQGTATVVLVG